MAHRSGSIVAKNSPERSPERRSFRNSITSTGAQLTFRPTDSDDPRMVATSQDNNKNRRASTIANKQWSATLTKLDRNASGLRLIDAAAAANQSKVARFGKMSAGKIAVVVIPPGSGLGKEKGGTASAPAVSNDSKNDGTRSPHHNADTMDSRSSVSRGMIRSRGTTKKDKPVYEIDHVGNETFQVSQLNLLSKRCLELVQTSGASLNLTLTRTLL